MRPSPSIEPFTPSPDISLPHPVLRAALDNLDVQLEEELVRYRRQRRLQSDKVQSNTFQSRFQADSAQSRSFTVGGAALGSRPIARRAQTGIDLPSFKDFNPGKDFNADGEFPIGNSSDAENPVKSILGSAIASQRSASHFSRSSASSLRIPSVEVPPFSPIEATLPTPAYQPKAYQPRTYQQPVPREEGFTALPLSSEEQPFSDAIGSDAIGSDSIGSDSIGSDSIGITSYAQQPELSAYVPNATLQKFVHEQRDNYSSDPEGYLESSEELLKSIQEETPLRVRRRADLLDLLLTPLGVGSMLLLLLSSATLGFLIMNPGTLSALVSPDDHIAANPASPNSSSPISGPLMRVPTTPIDSAPPSPDLSAEEFRDVNLNTLSTLPSGSSAAAQRSTHSSDRSVAQSGAQPSAPASAPTQTGGSRNAAPAIVPQSDLPTVPVQSQPVQPQPAQSAPAYAPPAYIQPPYSPPAYTQPPYNPSSSPSANPSSPSPTGSPTLPTQARPAASRPIDVPPPDTASSEIAVAPTSSSATTRPATTRSAAQDYYYVGTNYSGDSSLQQARQTVPDAYVRNLPSGGAIVQAGAFSSESAAKERVQELQQQGFPAQIYRP